MKTIIHSLAAFLFGFGALSFAGAAEDLKIATADMAHLYQNYHRAVDAQAKFQSAIEDAQSQEESMMTEGNTLVEDYRSLDEQAENPALSDEARDEARREADELLQRIREKEQEVQQFRVNTQRMLEQRQRSHRELLVEEIVEVVNEIARDRGSNLVLDTSNQSGGAVPTVLYSDPAFDVTEEALEELNRDQTGQ